MKKLLSIFIATVLATFLLIGCTDEAEAAPYVKLGVGNTTYNYDPAVVGLFVGDSARAYSIAIGHKIGGTSWLSLEFEYLNMGDANGTFFIFPTSFEAKAYTLWAVGDWTVGSIAGMPFDLSARAGYTKAKANGSIGPFGASDNDTGTAYGVGVKLWVTPATAITLDTTKRNLTFDLGGGSFDYDPRIVMLGVQHKF